MNNNNKSFNILLKKIEKQFLHNIYFFYILLYNFNIAKIDSQNFYWYYILYNIEIKLLKKLDNKMGTWDVLHKKINFSEDFYYTFYFIYNIKRTKNHFYSKKYKIFKL